MVRWDDDGWHLLDEASKRNGDTVVVDRAGKRWRVGHCAYRGCLLGGIAGMLAWLPAVLLINAVLGIHSVWLPLLFCPLMLACGMAGAKIGENQDHRRRAAIWEEMGSIPGR